MITGWADRLSAPIGRPAFARAEGLTAQGRTVGLKTFSFPVLLASGAGANLRHDATERLSCRS